MTETIVVHQPNCPCIERGSCPFDNRPDPCWEIGCTLSAKK